jgi:hypothetical protein
MADYKHITALKAAALGLLRAFRAEIIRGPMGLYGING